MSKHEAKRIAFAIWDGPLHNALVASRRYLWDEVLATAQHISTLRSKERDDD